MATLPSKWKPIDLFVNTLCSRICKKHYPTYYPLSCQELMYSVSRFKNNLVFVHLTFNIFLSNWTVANFPLKSQDSNPRTKSSALPTTPTNPSTPATKSPPSHTSDPSCTATSITEDWHKKLDFFALRRRPFALCTRQRSSLLLKASSFQRI